MNITWLLLKKLGPVRTALLRQGKIKQLLLMSNDLSHAEKAMLMSYMRNK